MTSQRPKLVVTSGFFNPIHSGHIALLEEARKLGDKLIVIVNSDLQVIVKGSKPFLSQNERCIIVQALRCVDDVFLSIDKDGTIANSLSQIAQNHPECEVIFAKGGDRNSASAMPKSELEACRRYNIEIVYGVGGMDKKNSSSKILQGLYLNE